MYKPVTVLEWCTLYILLCMWVNSSVSLREHVFSGWQTPLTLTQCGSTHMNMLPLQCPLAAKPLTVGPFMKTQYSGQLNNNFHISFRKLFLQYGCHDLQCQVWAGLSQMQSLCVHKNSTWASKPYSLQAPPRLSIFNSVPWFDLSVTGCSPRQYRYRDMGIVLP